jgi:hypothetical protein
MAKKNTIYRDSGNGRIISKKKAARKDPREPGSASASIREPNNRASEAIPP